MPEQEHLFSSSGNSHRHCLLPGDVRERADYSLSPRQGAAMGTIHRPLRCIQKDVELSHTSRLQGRKPLSKNRITKMSTPLSRVTSTIVDNEETLKASAIKLSLPTSQD